MHKADWFRYDDGQCEVGLWMRKDFQFIKAAASGIEGMLSVFSMALLDGYAAGLTFQRHQTG